MLILFSYFFSIVLPMSCDLRGVKNSDCQLYTAPAFQCDGKVLKPEYINDDYCDCPQSGLDEPGTSACKTGKFYCENKGYRSRTLFASRVDDGICDCCDGSDEREGLCTNTCKEKAFEEQKDMIDAINDYNKGLAAKKAFVGTHIIEQKEAKMVENKQKIEEENAKLEILREERKVLEEEERIKQEEEEKQRLIEEEKRKQEEAERVENEPEMASEDSNQEGAEASGNDSEGGAESPQSEEIQEEAQTNKDEANQQEQKEENFPYPEEYRPPQQEGGEGEAQADKQEENFPYPEEYRPKKEGEEELQVEEEDEEEDEEFDNFDYESIEHRVDDWDDDEVEDLPQKTKSEQSDSFFGSLSWLIDPLTNLYDYFFKKKGTAKTITSDALRSKDNDIRAVERTIRDLEKENEDLTNFVAMDFGESAAFAALADQCFSVNVDKYTYEMCLFNKAAQKEGSRSTSLGSFKSIEHFDDKTVIKFEGGQSCWKGPQRSLTVNVKCGSENKVLQATEPSMCAYEMDFRSPTACTESALDKLQSSFKNMYSDGKDEL